MHTTPTHGESAALARSHFINTYFIFTIFYISVVLRHLLGASELAVGLFRSDM